ncbi:TRAP transporter substrate-binding protein DctP [Gilvimarinus sp. F26214L]|uniref:TRAP transporter substrate-binding protein DctP n=1 Tax=Gilvimarinus sp. DZF01 TaxID=3461371 RepID=UPI0040455FA3
MWTCNLRVRPSNFLSGLVILVFGTGVLGAGLLPLQAQALRVEERDGESIYHLSYGSALSPTHTFSQADWDWIRYVENKSEGRLKVSPFWSGTLISSSQNVFELRHGVTDVAMITPIYMHAGMHATRVQTGFYAGAHEIETQVEVFHCLMRDFPVFGEELEGMKILAVQGGTPSYLLTRDRPIQTLEDLAGLRLRAPTALVPVVYALGGDPVMLPMGDVYPAFSKGIIDGVLTPEDTLLSMHFAEIGRYLLRLAMHRGAYPSRAISDRSWKQLPPDLQQLLRDSGRYWEQRIAHYVLQGNAVAVDYGLEKGVKTVTPDDAVQQHFDAVYNDIARRDAHGLSKYGINGVAILDRVSHLIQRFNNGHELNCP